MQPEDFALALRGARGVEALCEAGGNLAAMRFAGPLVLLVLVAAACSSSSGGGASDSGPDVPTSDAMYVPPTPCACPAGQELLLFGPPGWCPGSAPTGGASCGTDSCYTLCADGGALDATTSDGPADGAPDSAADAAMDAADATAEAAADATAEAATDGGAE